MTQRGAPNIPQVLTILMLTILTTHITSNFTTKVYTVDTPLTDNIPRKAKYIKHLHNQWIYKQDTHPYYENYTLTS